MLTWDNQATASAIALEAGIPKENVFAQVLPWDKANIIKNLQSNNIVTMIGDGINDSPALMQADVWIAMWSWADVAMEAGWVVLMKNDLNDVLTAIELSKATLWKIKQNMFFSLFYNCLWIPIAAWLFAHFGLILKPEFAGLAMAMSSVSVVLNSLFLKLFKPHKRNILSLIAPIILWLLFLSFFWNFSHLNDSFSLFQTEIKIWYTPDGISKNFIQSAEKVNSFPLIEWTHPDNQSSVPQMVLWYNEAKMMRNEGLFEDIGDKLTDFFGIPEITIVGILASNGTILDDGHILNDVAWDKIILTEKIITKNLEINQ